MTKLLLQNKGEIKIFSEKKSKKIYHWHSFLKKNYFDVFQKDAQTEPPKKYEARKIDEQRNQ